MCSIVVSCHALPCGSPAAVGSWIACIEETGCYWRGLVPSRWADVQSISWVAGESWGGGWRCMQTTHQPGSLSTGIA